jgi:NitT/TauT family transport system ATP-binding protein
MSKSPGRFVVKREIDLPRPRDLEVTYTPEFTDIVHELRGHIGAMRKLGTVHHQSVTDGAAHEQQTTRTLVALAC